MNENYGYYCKQYRNLILYTIVNIGLFNFVNMEMNDRNLFNIEENTHLRVDYISNRYLTNLDLKKFILEYKDQLAFKILGKSVEKKNIYGVKIGNGSSRILLWSQMHGNESTTTKAVLDLLKEVVVLKDTQYYKKLLDRITICIIPILNPDGAGYYTRVNANAVDLNRDMQQLSQPESTLLMDMYTSFQPDYCLNMHDQRTIFSAGDSKHPATISFLAPSSNEQRSLTNSRKTSMSLIAGMVQDLGDNLKNAIGRYDDGFNLNCAGDTFQYLGTPTILFEAGHYPGDYLRNVTRHYITIALKSCFHQIACNAVHSYRGYFELPENAKNFRDIIVRKCIVDGSLMDVIIQYKEVLEQDHLRFVPVIESIKEKSVLIGHWEIDGKNQNLSLPENTPISENVVVNKIFLNDEIIELNPY